MNLTISVEMLENVYERLSRHRPWIGILIQRL
jgi:hypothetical protein